MLEVQDTMAERLRAHQGGGRRRDESDRQGSDLIIRALVVMVRGWLLQYMQWKVITGVFEKGINRCDSYNENTVGSSMRSVDSDIEKQGDKLLSWPWGCIWYPALGQTPWR